MSDLQICGIQDWIEDDGTRGMILLYKTDRFEGVLSSSSEGKVYWVPLTALSHMRLADNMETLLKLFCCNTLTEQFFYKENGEWTEVVK